jgi:hypothetical protein
VRTSDSCRFEPFPLRRFECCTSWPRSVTETRLLSWGLPSYQSFSSDCSLTPIWVSANPSLPLLARMCISTNQLDFEVSKCCRPLTNPKKRAHPLSGFDSTYRVSPMHHREWTDLPQQDENSRPFRGFVPLQRLPSHVEPRRSNAFHLRRFSCVLRVSHPRDALLPTRPAGLISSQFRSWGLTLLGLCPHATPYALPNAGSLMKFRLHFRRRSACFSRETARRAKPEPQAWSLARLLRRMPIGALLPSKVSCLLRLSSRLLTRRVPSRSS